MTEQRWLTIEDMFDRWLEAGVIDDKDVATVFHEAGHAAAAFYLPHSGELLWASRIRDGNVAGSVVLDLSSEITSDPRRFFSFAVMLVAGGAAQQVAVNHARGVSHDLKTLNKLNAVAELNDAIVSLRHNDATTRRGLAVDLERAGECALALVKEHWPAIEELAAELVKFRLIGPGEIAAVLGRFAPAGSFDPEPYRTSKRRPSSPPQSSPPPATPPSTARAGFGRATSEARAPGSRTEIS